VQKNGRNSYLFVPGGHNILHVQVAGEEADDSVGNDGGQFEHEIAVVADDGRVVARLKPRRHRHLVIACKRHIGAIK
jgi:hypothetical protein